ncbi:DUF397 domain-containing protein [Streptomyces sp. 8P21H-1]|uniref:DUF397 domain-containing protein n=1 Tax=Streptomyces sp. 8P21H-1 TaxID=2737048 RepID=UPI00156E0834|nr:DUF397 domain-containing protein [Streptomyces sp. 8P21H-1]NSL43613.1 DUF397 domain-containing protein [Streptomyces sp. 8P21H-1]
MDVRPELRWFKSSYSGGSGTECVECARADGRLHVRDSKREDGPLVTVQAHAWRAFIRALQG